MKKGMIKVSVCILTEKAKNLIWIIIATNMYNWLGNY